MELEEHLQRKNQGPVQATECHDQLNQAVLEKCIETIVDGDWMKRYTGCSGIQTEKQGGILAFDGGR